MQIPCRTIASVTPSSECTAVGRMHSCFLPWWVYWASGSSGTTLRVQYPEVLSHEGIATITLWVTHFNEAPAALV